MGITHAEFLRSLPAAVEHRPFAVEGSAIRIEVGGGTVHIDLGPERTRAIASLRLPATRVRIRFDGLGAAERERFLARFDLYFRRGGG